MKIMSKNAIANIFGLTSTLGSLGLWIMVGVGFARPDGSALT
jgi:hypothetical protein